MQMILVQALLIGLRVILALAWGVAWTIAINWSVNKIHTARRIRGVQVGGYKLDVRKIKRA